MSYHKFSSKDYILFREPKTEFSPVLPDTSVPGDSPVFIDSTDSTDSHVSSSPPHETSADNRTKVKKKSLINRLNYIHFIDGTILVKLKHKKYDNEITLEAKPQPSLEHTLECLWIPTSGLAQKLQSYAFHHILLSDGLKHIQFEAQVLKIDERGITLELPDFCYEQSSRKIRRHVCKGIDVELIQNGAIFYGELIDFSSRAFKVKISTKPPQTFQWIQPYSPAHVNLKEHDKIYFTGEVKIIRHTDEKQKRSYVLEPVKNRINRFKEKEFRSLRYVLNPLPTVIFTHSLTKKTTTLPALDISGSGFSVEENIENSMLFPGLILPDLEIEIANKCSIKCLSQVLYIEKNHNLEKKGIKSGITILDIDIQDQMKLAGILQRSNNKNTYMCNKVNIDDLWRFLFDAGFIYPKKYENFYHNKEKFKETYEKLYIDHPQIARHFIYQDKGIIYGHMSMLRLFSKTWLYHHHASSSSTFRGPGIKVLNQIVQYTNDFYQHYSKHMDYIVCYYQPKNRFPNHVFGDFAKSLNNVNGCNIYPMTCLTINMKLNKKFILPSSIRIEPVRFEDLLELKNSIGHEFGRLLFNAFDFDHNLHNIDELSTEYERIGFKREKYVFSVKIYGKLKAIFLVLVSELGVNLSGLTNSIHVFVIDKQDFSKSAFAMVLHELQKYYQDKNIQILIYPTTYALDNNIIQNKVYNFWVFNSTYLDSFIKFTNEFLK